MIVFQTSFSAQSRLSTANSTNGAATYANMQLKTQVTLKSPFEGANLGPAPSKPQVGSDAMRPLGFTQKIELVYVHGKWA